MEFLLSNILKISHYKDKWKFRRNKRVFSMRLMDDKNTLLPYNIVKEKW